ncbi:probable serine/threonine-protein kinase dyrk2 isoform X2 [Zeugodacus cucurbitae]|uniref:probable serine/threonine-protein kinase dyrk2 isoform X2 n=1 Tax=Zeugodacus cucurbitae TaxID=28588 RepID=UPI0023D92D61|nr:probable serine/threonine-protein kinase dyrk2 isoform X2 [Zeugodacus cucurbitae]
MPLYKNANNSNQQQQHASTQQQGQHAKSPKLHKKTEKGKRSLSKTDSKKSINDLLKTQGKETVERPSNSSCCNSNYNSSSNSNSNKEAPSTSKSTLKPPTKVKSGSWKRSEKQISSYNGISVAGKKSKSLRKRSPTWLKFPNTPVKIAEKVTYVSPADSTSVCRPGTLYSDVLFGAGSSCLVKIKTLTPRRTANTAQKKLTKALLKCNGNETEAASASETETDRELFPSLNSGAVTASTSANATTSTPPDGSPRKSNTPLSATGSPMSMSATSESTITSTTNASKSTLSDPALPLIVTLPKCDDDADVVILSEANGVCGAAENGFNDVSYGNYLEQHFKQMNGAATTLMGPKALVTNMGAVEHDTCEGANLDAGTIVQPDMTLSGFPHMPAKPFTIDIPQWNFLDADVSTDAYPKFLCQFEDEHYLKAEKMALLGLKLALGNGSSNPQQAKFKF